MRLVATGLSDVGMVREGNEDNYLHDERLGIFAVADGMGGHEAGEVASAVAIEALRAGVAGGSLITEAVIQANTAVLEKADANPAMRGMGTTLTAAIEVEGGLRIGHVGDSRAYVLRDGILARVTDDHSLVEELVRAGQITLEQAAVHPQRSVITRALGIERDIEVDDISLELTDGDRVLICSDGLSGMVRETEISAIMRRETDTDAVARALIAAANAGGGEDNITVVVIDVIGEDGDPEPSALPEIGVGIVAVRAREARAAASRADTPLGAPSALESETSTKPRRRMRISRGVILAALPVVAIIAICIGVLGWYARAQYYVGFQGQRVAVFQGVPDGLAGWGPTLESSSYLSRSDLTPAQRASVGENISFPSEQRARAYVSRLEADFEKRTTLTNNTTSTTSTTSSTSTTSTTTP